MSNTVNSLNSVGTEAQMWLMLKVLIAATLGIVVGLERAHAGKVAGVRTHAFVSMASAAAVGTGMLVFAAGDPSRVFHAVITGVGFIGAGAIFKHKADLTGLTTAADLFFLSIVGALCGFGLVWAAMLSTVLAVVVLSLGGLNAFAQKSEAADKMYLGSKPSPPTQQKRASQKTKARAPESQQAPTPTDASPQESL